MEENTKIVNHIMDYLLEEGNKEISDPVLIEWLAESESNKNTFDKYKRIWNQSAHYTDIDQIAMHQAWGKIDKANKQKQNIRKRVTQICLTVSGMAACILILFALSVTGMLNKESDISVSLKVDYGNRSDITLPDGSLVKLNAGSDITYNYNTKTNIREVNFQGEAFFDVSESKDPFIVRVYNGLEIKVLGTSFNLSAYHNDKIIRASLVEGSIELNHPDNKLVIEAGEMAVFNKATNELERITGNLSHTYGWLENKLYMDNMSLVDVCKYVERRYNVNITLQKGLGEKIHYNGVIQEDNISDIMSILSRLSDIKYQIKGKNILITNK